MEVTAHPPQEVEGLLEGPHVARRQQVLQGGGPQHAVGGQGAGDPEQRVQVAQTPLAVLDVGLDGVPKGPRLLVPHVTLGQFGGDEGAGVGLFHRLAETGHQGVRQGHVTREKPRLQQGGPHRHVAFGQRRGLVQRAAGRPDLPTQIPQDVVDELRHLFDARRRLPRPQEQQVEGPKTAPAPRARNHPPPAGPAAQPRSDWGRDTGPRSSPATGPATPRRRRRRTGGRPRPR